MSKSRKAVTPKGNKAKEIKKVDIQSTEYGKSVLMVNANLKAECKSLGGARAMLILFAPKIKLKASFLRILKASKQSNAKGKLLYEAINKGKGLKDSNGVRTSKKGNYSPFFVLQFLKKHEGELLAIIKG